jgi:hypothetical protein
MSAHVCGLPLKSAESAIVADFLPRSANPFPAPGTYTLTLAIYGNNIQSTKHTLRIKIGEEPRDTQFVP